MLNCIKNTAFDTANYVSVIDWKASVASVELGRAASARRERAMASEDLNVRLAATGFIPGMTGAQQNQGPRK